MEKINQRINGISGISNYTGLADSGEKKKSYPRAVYYTPLINDETTLNELVELLKNRSELEEAAKFESEEWERVQREARLLRLISDEYNGYEDSADTIDRGSEVKEAPAKLKNRPGSIQLRSKSLCIGQKELHTEGLGKGLCEVFSNGYVVYDNGDRKTVVWLPEYSDYFYYFNPLRESEKLYQREYDKVSEQEMGMLPWHIVVLMKGEEQIEKNLVHPKSQGSLSDFEKLEEWDQKKSYKWTCGAYFENPEDAYLWKEEEEERMGVLTEKQREVYDLYFVEGYTQVEIAKILCISQVSVLERIKGIRKKIKDREKLFY